MRRGFYFSWDSAMNNQSSYKGYTVKSLVFQDRHSAVQAQDRIYNVAVRIERSGDPAWGTRTFQMEADSTLYSLGDARRAAEDFGRAIIDGRIPGCSVSDPAGEASGSQA